MKKQLNQYATISGLSMGNYDGTFLWKDILPRNNFGLGTFDRLDGEMIGFDNQFFKIKSDGTVHPIDENEKTPFASLTNFADGEVFELQINLNKADLSAVLKPSVNPNHIYALKITGKFNYIATRTVSIQEKPYVKLVDASKDQTTLEKTDQYGTMIGYWTPSLYNTVGVEGLHLHFLNETKDFGGHVLDFELGKSQMELLELSSMDLVFDVTNQKIISNQEEIHQAEK